MAYSKKEELYCDGCLLKDIAEYFPSDVESYFCPKSDMAMEYRKVLYFDKGDKLISVSYVAKSGFPEMLNDIFEGVYKNIPSLDGYPKMYNAKEVEGGFTKHCKELPEVAFNNKYMITINV